MLGHTQDVPPPQRTADLSRGRSLVLDRGYADFHEKASLVKGDVATATTVRFSATRVMLPCVTLCEPASCGSVHYEIRLFGLLTDAAIFRAVSPQRNWAKSACAVAFRDPKRSGNLYLRRCSRVAMPGSSPPLSLLAA